MIQMFRNYDSNLAQNILQSKKERCYVPRLFFAAAKFASSLLLTAVAVRRRRQGICCGPAGGRAARRMTIFTFPSSHLAVKLETLGVKKANMRLNFLGKIFYLGEKPYLEGKGFVPCVRKQLQRCLPMAYAGSNSLTHSSYTH